MYLLERAAVKPRVPFFYLFFKKTHILCDHNAFFCKKICTCQKKTVILRTKSQKYMIDPKTNMVEAPVMETSQTGGRKEFLTADELMQRIEPHIRSLFR